MAGKARVQWRAVLFGGPGGRLPTWEGGPGGSLLCFLVMFTAFILADEVLQIAAR